MFAITNIYTDASDVIACISNNIHSCMLRACIHGYNECRSSAVGATDLADYITEYKPTAVLLDIL